MSKRVAFRVRNVIASAERRVEVIATCNICFRVLTTSCKVPEMFRDLAAGQELREDSLPPDWILLGSYPAPPEPRTIAHLPPPVSQSFDMAEKQYAMGHWGDAAMRFRQSIERWLKLTHPEAKANSLYKRIEGIKDTASLPTALIDLMHQIRLFGNEIHEMEDPTQDQTGAARDFTHLFLIYVVEMPERVRIATEKRAES